MAYEVSVVALASSSAVNDAISNAIVEQPVSLTVPVLFALHAIYTLGLKDRHVSHYYF